MPHLDAVSADMRIRIRETLQEIAAEEQALILFAAESGSRAWGFHSEDSDYDVRFVYARPLDWHLRVRPGRDVIERPISDALDLGGWELRKALGLALGSNAVISEWLRSPIIYAEAEGFAEEMRRFCGQALNWRSVSWHYRRLAERQRDSLRDGDGRVKLKRYFYTLRPALALRWLRMFADDHRPATPPMNMAELLRETDPGAAVRDYVEALIETKRRAGEMGVAEATHGPIDALIEDELRAAARRLEEASPAPARRLSEAADTLHARWTRIAEDHLGAARLAGVDPVRQ